MHPLSYLGQRFSFVDLALPYVASSVLYHSNYEALSKKREQEFPNWRYIMGPPRPMKQEQKYRQLVDQLESVEKHAYRNLQDAKSVIASLVHLTIMDLAEVLGIQMPPFHNFPAVFVFDEMRARAYDYTCSVDADCAPFCFYPRTSSFSSNGGYS